MNQGGGNDLDEMEDELEEVTHPQVKGSRIRYELKTSLNSEYFTSKHATRQSMDNQLVNISEDEQIETILDPNMQANIEEALRGNEKEAWKKSAESEIREDVHSHSCHYCSKIGDCTTTY